MTYVRPLCLLLLLLLPHAPARQTFLGHDKVWAENLIAYPDRWSGDPCVQAWDGKHNVYVNNTCVLGGAPPNTSNFPDAVGLDDGAGVNGNPFLCHLDLHNKSTVAKVGVLEGNRYFTALGNWSFLCPDNSSFDKGVLPRVWELPELEKAGWEVASSVGKTADMTAARIIAQARLLLTWG